MGGKEDKGRMGCPGGINPEGCCDSSSWGTAWEGPRWVQGVPAGLSVSSLCPCQVFTRYGKCYTFNSGRDGRPLLKTMKGGTGNGLEIMLDIQQDEYLPVWGETGTSPLGGPSPWFQASNAGRGLLGCTAGPEAGLGFPSLPPSISPSPSLTLPDCHTHISPAPPSWLSYSPR